MIMGSRVRICLVHLFEILFSSGVDDRGHRLRSGSPVTIYPPAAAPCSKATITRCDLSSRFFCIDATLLCEFESDKI